MRTHEQRIPLEGSARLLAWYEDEARNGRDVPGQFFVELVSGGKSLTGPILLGYEPMTTLIGPDFDRIPEERPFRVELGPLIVRGWDLECSVEFRGKVAGGSLVALRSGIRRTFMP